MRILAPLLCLLLGLLLGWVARPTVRTGPAAPPPAREDSTASASARRGVAGDDGEEDGDVFLPMAFDGTNLDTESPEGFLDDLRGCYRRCRFRRDPSCASPPPADPPKPAPPDTVAGLRTALLAPAPHPGASRNELARLLVNKLNRGGIRMAFTLRLARLDRYDAARITMWRWSDADLLEGLRRAAAGAGGDLDRLVGEIVSTLSRRRAVRVPDDLLRALLGSPDPRLRMAGASISMFPHALRAERLVGFLRDEREPTVKAHAVACLAELVEEKHLPPERAAPLVIEAARCRDWCVREEALKAFPLVGAPAVEPSLLLLADEGFRQAAPDEIRQGLVLLVAAHDGFEKLPAGVDDPRLASDFVSVLSGLLWDETRSWGEISGSLPRVLSMLTDENDASRLFDDALDHDDEAFVRSAIADRALDWRIRLAAVRVLFQDDERDDLARRIAADRIRDATEPPGFRIALARGIEPPEESVPRAAWAAMLRAAGAADRSDWVRITLLEIAREYEE